MATGLEEWAEHVLDINGGYFMVYEIAWLFFALGAAVLISIGFLGLVFSSVHPTRILKVMALMISVLIILTGIYLSSQWSAQKKEIRVLTQQTEEAIKEYLASHPKK